MDFISMNRYLSTILCFLNIFTCFLEGNCEDWQMLARANSSVSLFCDAIFKHGHTTATWYKDSKPIGNVNDKTNLFLGPIPPKIAASLESIPDLGFLIIPSVSKADEGNYACYNDNKELSGTKAAREVDLRVAFLADDFNNAPGWAVARIGASVTMKCSPPNGYPHPTISWTKHGQHIHNTGRVHVLDNGNLQIDQVQSSDGGEYLCRARNVIGHRVVKAYLLTDNNNVRNHSPITAKSFDVDGRRWLLWGHLLWFIVGMVLTASIVLMYALFALTCMRPRNTVQPRALDAPAFTKIAHPIIPVPV